VRRKITTVVRFLNICWEFVICKFGFGVCSKKFMNFEMPSEMQTGTAESCRSGKRIKEM
jgi:hypothetical protein